MTGAAPDGVDRSVSWPRDDAKLERVRALMAEQELDALVVRAPDNVLYLTNFWGMKGYDAVVFPREGEPALICLEASADDADAHGLDERRPPLRAATTSDDPRPPHARALELARAAVASGYERVGLELSLGTQASDRMVGEPTTYTQAWFDAFGRTPPTRRRCSPRRARSRPTQEIERMRLANEIAAAAMEHVRERAAPGMKESEAAAMWQGFVHGEGTGWNGQGRARARLLARLVGPGHPHVHGDRRPARAGGRADAVRDLGLRRRLLVRPHEEPLPGRAAAASTQRLLERRCSRSTSDAVAHCRPGASLAELDRRVREGIAAAGYPGQPSHPICHGVGARAHEPPYAHQAGGGDDRGGHGARDRAGHATGTAAAACASRTTSCHRRRRREALAVPRRSCR